MEKELGQKVSMKEVKNKLKNNLEEVFGLKFSSYMVS